MADLETTRHSVAVVGGGTMGVGIVYVFAAAGFDVWLVEPDEARAQAVRLTLDDVSRKGVARANSNISTSSASPTIPPRSARRCAGTSFCCRWSR